MPPVCSLNEIPSFYDSSTMLDRLDRQHPLDGAIALAEQRLLQLIAEKLQRGERVADPTTVKRYLRALLAGRTLEQCVVLWLDTRLHVITHEVIALGTIDGATVHTRRVLESALRHNAAACILAHNHPSGNAEPSSSDDQLTTNLRDALRYIDVRLVDHVIVAGDRTTSYAERGLL